MTRPGLLGFRTAPIASQGLDWPTLDAIWAAAGDARRLLRGLDERPPDRRQRRPRRRRVRIAHHRRRARASRAGQVDRDRRAGEHVPASGGRGEGRDRPRQRDRRPVHPGPRRRLARGRARDVRHPAAADGRAIRALRERRRDARRAVLRRRPARAGRHARRSVLPAPRRDAGAGADPRRAARRSGSAASAAAGSRSRRASPRAGSCPATARATSPTSSSGATRSCGRSRRPAATRPRSPSRARSTCRPTDDGRRSGARAGPRVRFAPARTT